MEGLNQGKVLLVGDGDFSFTLALLKNSATDPASVTTSNLASNEAIQQHKQALDNMAILRDMGTTVFLETDACELHTHPMIGQQIFDRIIFNFPLADRHNIKKNRALLADFFSSSKQILSDDGQVLVTLCKGQGGTPADQPRRLWQDSWQVVAMATGAGLALTQVLPFDSSRFPEYHSVGFRFQDKSFNTEGALVHIFEKTDQVDITAHAVRSTVTLEGNTYSCSNYVASRIERDLSVVENHPVCKLRTVLETNLTHTLRARTVSTNLNSRAVKNHRSLASFHIKGKCYQYKEFEQQDREIPGSDSSFDDAVVNTCAPHSTSNSDAKVGQVMAVDAVDVSGKLSQTGVQDHCKLGLKRGKGEVCDFRETEMETDKDETEAKKERKDEVNRNRTKKLLAHGVDPKEQDSDSKAKGNLEEDHRNQGLLRFLPEDPENVYILIKTNSTSKECLPGDQDSEILPDGGNAESSSASSDKTTVRGVTDLAEKVFHCRASLLEELPGLCGILDSKRGDSLEILKTDAAASPGKESDEHCDPPLRQCDLDTGQVDGHCVIASGLCVLPVAIMPHFLPASHQMIVVQRVNSKLCGSCDDVEESSFEEKNMQCPPCDSEQSGSSSLGSSDLLQGTNQAISSLMSTLKQSPIFSEFSLTLKRHISFVSIEIQDVDNTELLNYVFLKHNTSLIDTEDGERGCLIGVLLQVQIGNNSFLVCLLSLDVICSTLCSIPSLRLLWSGNKKFMKQFKCVFPIPFTSICLFPLKFAHDLSFWERGMEPFDERQLHEIIRTISGDLVINVELIDRNEEPETGKRSRCYRLHFLSYDQALTYSMSWQLQSRIRMELARVSGVILR